MPQPIEYIIDTAGFVKNEVYDTGRKVKRPNTQVVALAIFESLLLHEEVTYQTMFVTLSDDVRAWVMKPGRPSNKRRQWRTSLNEGKTMSLNSYRIPMEFLKSWIEERYPDLVWVPTTWIGAKEQLHLDQDVFEKDKLILARLSSDEVVPIHKGEARYPWDPNHTLAEGKSRMVYGYWTQP